ncbi:uncharacterized protein ACNS7B_019076 [Menidia menidia]
MKSGAGFLGVPEFLVPGPVLFPGYPDTASEVPGSCLQLLLLVLGLHLDFSGGRVLPENPENPENPELKSIGEDLLKALQNLTGVLRATEYFRGMPELQCEEKPIHLDQGSEVAQRLVQSQACAAGLHPLAPDGPLCAANALNHELLQHLEPKPKAPDCPSYPPTPPPPTPPAFAALRRLMQCVHCWSQQVAALIH